MEKLTFLYLLLTFSLYNLFQTNHAIDNKQSGFSLQMFHFNSPQLPSYKPNRTCEQIMDKLISISNARVEALGHLDILNSSHTSTNHRLIRPRLEAISSEGVFMVQVGIGTLQRNLPFQPNYLVLDTSSTHTWTQCEGCNPCFRQRGPLFPWLASSTLSLAPCSSCPTGCQRSGHCTIDIEYGSGTAVRDTFSFQSTAKGITEDHVASGIFALDPLGYSSLMSHISDFSVNNGRFSYSFPPIDEPIQQPLYLRFGGDMNLPTYHHATPTLQSPGGILPFYFIQLLDLSVGGRRLGINSHIFSLNQVTKSGGCVIDSISPFSYLTPVAYHKLEQHIIHQYEENNIGLVERVYPSPLPLFPVCYEQKTTRVPISPEIIFHFQSQFHLILANLTVAKPMGRSRYGDKQLHCLEILSTPSGTRSIIGAMHQINHRFVYDNRHKLLHFFKADCATLN